MPLKKSSEIALRELSIPKGSESDIAALNNEGNVET